LRWRRNKSLLLLFLRKEESSFLRHLIRTSFGVSQESTFAGVEMMHSTQFGQKISVLDISRLDASGAGDRLAALARRFFVFPDVAQRHHADLPASLDTVRFAAPAPV
jgi:hypothetical protein